MKLITSFQRFGRLLFAKHRYELSWYRAILSVLAIGYLFYYVQSQQVRSFVANMAVWVLAIFIVDDAYRLFRKRREKIDGDDFTTLGLDKNK